MKKKSGECYEEKGDIGHRVLKYKSLPSNKEMAELDIYKKVHLKKYKCP